MRNEDWEEKTCNTRLIEEVSEEQQVRPAIVDGILKHYNNYIADTIRSGTMEGVMVPYLGKFQVKLKNQQYRAYLHSLHPVFKRVMESTPSNLIENLFTNDNPTDDCDDPVYSSMAADGQGK